MERITFDGNFCDIVTCHNVDGSSTCEKETCDLRRTWERLKEIEDILGDDYDLDRLKVLVDQRMTMREEVAKRFSITKDIPVDRLQELVEADRDGRCVVLPCKLHDKVFFVENGCVKETEVDSFHNWTSGRWKMSTHTDRMYDHWKGYEIDFSGIGKTVFLARKEAEASLKGEQHDNFV